MVPTPKYLNRSFDQAKREGIAALLRGQDKSLKGSLDAPIVELVNYLNSLPDYVTTSSCSGRVALFQDVGGDTVCKKSEGRWLLSSHVEVTLADVKAALEGTDQKDSAALRRNVTLKQEPFIMHVECRSLPAAERLFRIAFTAGFRESGIGLGKKILVAVRTTSNSIEAPVILGGEMLLTSNGLSKLVDLANRKFQLNVERTQRFEGDLRAAFASGVEGEGAEGQPHDEGGQGTLQDGEAHGRRAKQRRKRSKAGGGLEDNAQGSSVQEGMAGVRVELSSRLAVWEPLALVGAEAVLRRWGHSLCQSGPSEAWVFGGYGYHGKQLVRLGSLVHVDLTKNRAREVSVSGTRPAAREKHAACLLKGQGGQVMVVFGGRAAPTSPMDDLWVLGWDGIKPSWSLVEDAAGQAPSPRWGHSMTAVGSRAAVVYGGRNEKEVLGDVLHVVTITEGLQGTGPLKWTWSQVQLEGPSAGVKVPPLFLHSSCAITGSDSTTVGGEKIFVFGGLADISGSDLSDRGYLIDVRRGRVCSAIQCARGGRYAHAAMVLPNSRQLVIMGGMMVHEEHGDVLSSALAGSTSCPTLTVDFEDTCTSSTTTAAAPGDTDTTLSPSHAPPPTLSTLETHYLLPEPPMLGHQLCVSPQGLCSVGGGVQTFAFAPVFCPPHLLRLPVTLPPAPAPSASPPPTETKAPQSADSHSVSDKGSSRPVPEVAPRVQGASEEAATPCLLVRTKDAATVKRALANLDMFDKTHRIAAAVTRPIWADGVNATLGGPLMAVPVVPNHFQILRPHVPPATDDQPPPPPPASGSLAARLLASLPPDTLLGWAYERVPESVKKLYGRTSQLSSIYATMTERYEVSSALIDAAPRGLEKVGDVLLLEHDDFAGPAWEACHEELWPALCRLCQAQRVARLAPIEASTKRRSQVRLIWPATVAAQVAELESAGPEVKGQEGTGHGVWGTEASPGWVVVRENGLKYGFDLTRVMFSSGNVSEKARVALLDCRGETVVDLYAGIGYYVLPYLVHSRASHVIACEWNPHSLHALRHNLKANHVAERATVLAGDNRVTTKDLEDGIAHRVNLGLLPSSEEGWPIAVRLLRPSEGGWLHVHANVLESAIATWQERVVATVSEMGQQMAKGWGEVRCVHLEKVKSYAPRVWHVVADIHCSQGAPEGQA